MECNSRNKLPDHNKIASGRLVPVPRPHSKKSQSTLTAWPYIAAVSPAVEAKLVSNFLFPHQAESGLTSTVSPEPHSESILWEWLHPPLIRICIGVIQNVIAPKAKRRAKSMRTTLSLKLIVKITTSVVPERVTRRSQSRRNPVSVRSLIFDRP